MPTYEYVCTECGEPLEIVQSIHEPALTECPACHGRLRKVFGNVGVVFKGSGFYRTDSRGKSSAATPAAKKAESGTSGTSGATPPSSGSSDSGSSSGTSSTASGSSTTSSGTSGSSSAKAPAAS